VTDFDVHPSFRECGIPDRSIAEMEHPALRRPTRQFTVEVRSSNRRSSLKPTSIWGDIDLKALAREAGAEIARDRGPVPAPTYPVEALNEIVEPVLCADDDRATVEDKAGPEFLGVEIDNDIDVALPVRVAAVGEKATRQSARPRKTKRRRPGRTLEAQRAVDAVAQTDIDWLLAENHKLKLLFQEKLLRENALLRDMLNRN